jgi:hypothetical protein
MRRQAERTRPERAPRRPHAESQSEY